VQVKGNQKFLLQDCEDVAENQKPTDTSESTTNGHGRREKRTAWVFTRLSSFSASIKKRWGKYIKAVIKVRRVRREFDTRNKQWKRTVEEVYYVATKPFTAREANRLIREHWGIENRNHYVRDVTMHEDWSRIRINPDRMVRIRSLALNIMRHNGEKNIAMAQHENVLSLQKMLDYSGFEKL
jgi:predicted transposase YbfD/YdcC